MNIALDYDERLGLRVDVWIDDDPACILHGKQQEEINGQRSQHARAS